MKLTVQPYLVPGYIEVALYVISPYALMS